MNDISARLERVRSQIVAAAQTARRDPAEVELVAVSKTQDAPSVRRHLMPVRTHSAKAVRRNWLQKRLCFHPSTRWHFIGHLQRNKIRKILPLVELIHSVDSMELAQDIDRIAEELGLFPRILLEVNVAGEVSKFGFKPDALREQLETLLALPRVQVEGLMTIAPVCGATGRRASVFHQIARSPR